MITDINVDDMAPDDLWLIAKMLLANDNPVPVDIIAKLHNCGYYIAH